MTDTVFLNKHGIQKRMKCSGQTAHRIKETFVTVGQLVDAVEDDEPLTGIDGIGPKTAATIREWWENRFEREERVGDSSRERTGEKAFTIHIHHSWSDYLGDRSVGADTDREVSDS